jgi:hypothetical protein
VTKPAKKASSEPRPLTVAAQENETEPESMARVMVEPYLRHGAVTSALSDKMIGKLPGEPRFDDFGKMLKAKGRQQAGDRLQLTTEVLMAQALSLDSIFTEYARRAAMNIGEYINASERYMRVALKAQSQSRATLETLVRLHQPREQTVKHVHVNEGGQAVVADNFHQHTGGSEKHGKSDEQSHATGVDAASAALPSPDPERDGMPITSGQREAAMQDARRDESGRP